VSKVHFTYLYLGVLLFATAVSFSNLNVPNDYLIIALAAAVTLLGLPHGALDFKVAKSLSLFSSSKSAMVFLIGYVAIAALSIVFWLMFPASALIIFLSVSVYHFSADWRALMPMYARLSLAAIIICGPAIFYSTVVINLFAALLVSVESSALIVKAMQLTFTASLLIFIYYLGHLLKKEYIASRQNSWRLAESIALIVSSLTLSPLLHFGLYFCLLHSPKHLEDVSRNLNISLPKAVIKSIPFVVLTLLFAGGAYAWFNAYNDPIEVSSAILRWVFIGLFGLTMSHMILIDLWHRTK
jgi:Brp/Blh family beta-carotene 15,15'-monooxygenase